MERCFTARELVITRARLQWNAAYDGLEMKLVLERPCLLTTEYPDVCCLLNDGVFYICLLYD